MLSSKITLSSSHSLQNSLIVRLVWGRVYSDCMIGVGAGVLTDCVAGTSVLIECAADAGVGAGMDAGVLTDCVAGAAVGAGVLRLRGGRGCRLYQVVRGVALGYCVVNVGAGVLTDCVAGAGVASIRL